MLLHCLYEIKVPKGYAFAKTYGEKISITKTPLPPNLVGAYMRAWESLLSPPMGLMPRTEAVLVPAVCHGLLLAVIVAQGNSLSRLAVLSTTFSRHSPGIGPKITFPPKRMIPPSSRLAACSQCPLPRCCWPCSRTGSGSQVLMELKAHPAKGEKDPFPPGQQGDLSHPAMRLQEHMAGRSRHSPFH